MASAKFEAAIRRRQRERQLDAEDALERRTYRTYNRHGEPRHMIGWSRAEIDAWEEKEHGRVRRSEPRDLEDEGCDIAPVIVAMLGLIALIAGIFVFLMFAYSG